MPEDLKLSQIGSSLLLPPFRGLHSPRVRKHCQIIFTCYFWKLSILKDLSVCVSCDVCSACFWSKCTVHVIVCIMITLLLSISMPLWYRTPCKSPPPPPTPFVCVWWCCCCIKFIEECHSNHGKFTLRKPLIIISCCSFCLLIFFSAKSPFSWLLIRKCSRYILVFYILLICIYKKRFLFKKKLVGEWLAATCHWYLANMHLNIYFYFLN